MSNNPTVTPQQSPFLEKALGYIGLLAVVLFAALVFSPWSKPKSEELSSYVFKTGVFHVLFKTHDGLFLRTLSRSLEDCKFARARASSPFAFSAEQKAMFAREIELACNVVYGSYLTDTVESQLERRAPGITVMIKKLGSTSSPEQRNTPEYQQILSSVKEHYLAEGASILRRLTIAAWVGLCLSLIAVILGVNYRRKVGYFVIYPFLVVASIGKLAHKKV